jgi:hypothetical protein
MLAPAKEAIMTWQIVAISLIAASAVAWFISTERRRGSNRAARPQTNGNFGSLSNAGALRAPAQTYSPMGLSAADRMFLDALAKNARSQD